MKSPSRCMFAFAFAFSTIASAQVQHAGNPWSDETSLASTIATLVMPPLDVRLLLAEDRVAAKDIPFRFGYPFMLDYGIANSGTWDVLPDGRKIWRLAISSPGALSINLIFDKFLMPSGAAMYVYNADKSMRIGAFTSENNLPDNVFSTAPVSGDRIIIEYNEPAGHGRVATPVQLNISVVVHAYRNIFKLLDEGGDAFGDAGACNINVNCPLGDPWKTQARSVGMVLTSSNSRICTGSLINNTRNNGTPFFLTANHCWDSSQPTWIIMFKYESPSCTNIDGPTTNTISGSTLLARNTASDFCLIRLSSAPPASYNVYYAGWNRQDVAATSGAGIHHPRGDIKKISFSNSSFLNATWSGTPANSHWQVNWSTINSNTAVTEPGSSGSPIFDQNKRIVGQLHGGPSYCGAPSGSLNDVYGKFSMSWDYGTTAATRARDWLDSLNTGALSLDGFDPTSPISYTPLANTSANGNRQVTGVTITDPDGVAGGANAPRIYWRVNTGGWNSAATPSPSSPYDFTIATSGLLENDVVYYYIIAQDNLGNVFANPGAGLVATSVNNVTTHPTTPNSYTIIPNGTVSYATLGDTIWTGARNLNNVAITDPEGVVGTGPNAPRIYWKVNSGSWFSSATSSTASPFSFVIGTTGLTNADTVRYYVIAQDNTGSVFASPINGLVATNVNTVITHPTNPNSYRILANPHYGGGLASQGGYYFANSTPGALPAPSQPGFSWRDTTGSVSLTANGSNLSGGLLVGSLDDGRFSLLGKLPTGNSFRFFGTSYTDVYVGTNGIIGFTPFTYSGVGYYNPPSAGLPTTNITNAFFPLWMDLDFGNSSVATKRLSYKISGNEFIVTYSQAPLFSGGATDYVSFQIVMEFTMNPLSDTRLLVQYDDGKSGSNFLTQYNANTLATHLVGLQSGGTNSLSYRFRNSSTVLTTGPIFSSPVAVQFGPDVAALPVQLASFTAAQYSNGVRLNWTTLSEVNNYGFYVQHRGESFEHFADIPNSFIAGHGTTAEPRHYAFVHSNISSGVHHYRLRQVDLDGTNHFTDPISIALTTTSVDEKAPRVFALFQNYPNPFNPSTEIKFSVENTDRATLEVYNLLGQKVATLFDDVVEAGFYQTVKFSATNLASGIYLYRLQSGTKSDLKKLLLLK